jgi:hypothetical protein
MALKFKKLDRREIRKLKQPGEKLTEHGITFERLPKGDGRYTINIMVDGVRVHRRAGRELHRTDPHRCSERPPQPPSPSSTPLPRHIRRT